MLALLCQESDVLFWFNVQYNFLVLFQIYCNPLKLTNWQNSAQFLFLPQWNNMIFSKYKKPLLLYLVLIEFHYSISKNNFIRNWSVLNIDKLFDCIDDIDILHQFVLNRLTNGFRYLIIYFRSVAGSQYWASHVLIIAWIIELILLSRNEVLLNLITCRRLSVLSWRRTPLAWFSKLAWQVLVQVTIGDNNVLSGKSFSALFPYRSISCWDIWLCFENLW